MNNRPIWIIVDNGDMFEGHQLHWADTFFSNATRSAIEHALQNDALFNGLTYEIREMTEIEILKYSELPPFIDFLLSEYGEV